MSSLSFPLGAELRASAITSRSTLAHYLPWYHGINFGARDTNYVPVRWRRAAFAPESNTGWLQFQPDPAVIAARAIAGLSVDKDRLAEATKARAVVPAIIYRLSRAATSHEVIMAGTLESEKHGPLLTADPDDPARLACGIKNVNGGIWADIGAYDIERRTFRSLHDDQSHLGVVDSSINTLPVVQRLDT